MNKFYSFQEKMGIIDQHCYYNCKYLKEKLKEYNIYTKSVNGLFMYGFENNTMFHNWLEYDGDVIEPNKKLYDMDKDTKMYVKEKELKYYLNDDGKIMFKKHLEAYDQINNRFHLIHKDYHDYINMLWSREIDVKKTKKIIIIQNLINQYKITNL